jgi:uncharacterized membrane protein
MIAGIICIFWFPLFLLHAHQKAKQEAAMQAKQQLASPTSSAISVV